MRRNSCHSVTDTEQRDGLRQRPLIEALPIEPARGAELEGDATLLLRQHLELLLHVVGRDGITLVGDADGDEVLCPAPLPALRLKHLVLERRSELGAEEESEAREEVGRADDAVELDVVVERGLDVAVICPTIGQVPVVLLLRPGHHTQSGVLRDLDVQALAVLCETLLGSHLPLCPLLLEEGLVVEDGEVLVEVVEAVLLQVREDGVTVGRDLVLEMLEERICVGLDELLLLLRTTVGHPVVEVKVDLRLTKEGVAHRTLEKSGLLRSELLGAKEGVRLVHCNCWEFFGRGLECCQRVL